MKNVAWRMVSIVTVMDIISLSRVPRPLHNVKPQIDGHSDVVWDGVVQVSATRLIAYGGQVDAGGGHVSTVFAVGEPIKAWPFDD